jgi:hypothetical protein
MTQANVYGKLQLFLRKKQGRDCKSRLKTQGIQEGDDI